jgi:aryl-alcohol dehydrogenase-like predicted oxidoreductase
VKTRTLGPLGETSVLALGGAGIGRAWGETTTEETLATVTAAVGAGITLLDAAAVYGTAELPREAERLIGEAFGGRLPDGVRVVTKVAVLDDAPDAIRRTVRESLEESLRVMRLDRVAILFHHSHLRPPRLAQSERTLSLDLYRRVLRPEFEALREEGLIDGWGLTATGHPEAVFAALAEEPRPYVVQSPANLLDSPGSLWSFGPEEEPDNLGVQACARAAGVGVMGIRAVQRGALTDAIDVELPEEDPNQRDYRRAAGFRELAGRRGQTPAFLAYRYALSMENVDTVVLRPAAPCRPTARAAQGARVC